MKTAVFNGGLNTRVESNLISANEGVIYENIDNSKGSLVPVKDKVDTNIEIGKYAYFFEAENKWISSNNKRHYVEYINKLYFSEPATYPKWTDGNNEYKLGIDAPDTLNLQILDEALIPITGCTLTESAGSTFSAGDLASYLLVNKNVNGLFSQPFYKTINITGSNQVTISALQDFNTETYVYRNYNGVYYYVGNITTSGGTLVDSTADISGNLQLDETKYLIPYGTYQYVYTFYNSSVGHESAPSNVSTEIDLSNNGGTIKLTNLEVSSDSQVDKKRIYRIGGNLTVFTLVEEIDNSITEYSDVLGDTKVDGHLLDTGDASVPPANLDFLTEANGILFGAIDNILRFTPVNQPYSWPEDYFIRLERNITGIGATSVGVIVFIGNKAYVITGTDSSVFTKHPLSRQQGCINHDTVVDATNFLGWVSNDGICSTSGGLIAVVSLDKLGKTKLDTVNSVVLDEVYYTLLSDGTVLAYDYGLGGVLKTFNFGVDRLIVANDSLYGHSGGKLYQLLVSNDNMTLRFKSGKFTEGQFSMHKIYKSFYFRISGELTITIYVDEIQVAKQSFSGDEQTVEIKVDQGNHRGYSCEVLIEGTGNVYEMENKVLGRQNGK